MNVKISRTDRLLHGFIIASLIVFALPRADHPALPFGVSGLDLAFIPLALGLLISMFNGRLRPAGKDLFFKYVLIIPVLMLTSNLVAFLVHNESDSLMRGVLQSVRRVPAVMIMLLMYQSVRDLSLSVRLCKLLVASTIAGGVMFVMLANGLIGPLKPVSDLVGNPLSLIAGMAGIPMLPELLTDYRMGGNTGSPTTYGVICGTLLLLVLSLYSQKLVSRRYFVVASILLFSLLLASAAKAALVASILVYVVALLRHRRGIIMVMTACGLLSIAAAGYFASAAADLATRGASSFDDRLEKYETAMTTLETNPSLLFVGEGWRSREVGWHSEPVELLMGFGVPVGMACIAVMYIGVPWMIIRKRRSAAAPIRLDTALGMFFIILYASLFQDIFHDGNILFMLAVLFGIMYGEAGEQTQKDSDTDVANL